MKLKYLFLTLILLMIGIGTVDAKSIEYNLTIDKDLYFHEANVYRVNDSELDTSGNYDFMTSVVKDKIYFDNDNGVPYTKTKKKANGEYIVTLKNDYSPIFLTGSRILNECFSEFDFKDNEKSLSIKTTSPFYCYSRADSIVINIKTDLKVTSSNADSVNGNTYTWNSIDKNFTLRFAAEIPDIENAPMEKGYSDTGEVEDEDNDQNNTQNNEDEQTNNNNDETTSSISGIVIAVIFIIISIAAVIIFIILNQKKSNLNKI